MPVRRGLERGRRELNRTRAELGLRPLEHVHGGISRRLALVATFPQLEYPRRWPPWAHVVGPLMWEPPAQDVEPPPGEQPLVLVAPSTAQDPEHRLLRAALAGLAGRARARARDLQPPPAPAAAARSPPTRAWSTGSPTRARCPLCRLVVCHAGHGTLVRALCSGAAVLACPAVGDMSENAARVDWAGAGVRIPPHFIRPRAVRLAAERALGERGDRRART